MITKGSCDTDENGKFFIKDYEARQAYANSKLKGTRFIGVLFVRLC